ncbi:ATP-binding protein [Salarchaeum japonicum]|uniref:ATP-binding protein n=1 Tax=Salarchaeum japonicum TaxID=555573 RepID=UPI003C73858C
MTVSPSLVIIDATVAAVFLLLAAVGIRHRDRPGARIITALWLVLAALSTTLVLARTDIVAGRPVASALLAGWLIIVPLWAGFVFEYTGRGPPLTRPLIAITAVYVLGTGVASLHGTALTGPLELLVRTTTSILQTALIGVGLFGVFLLVRSTATYDDLPRGRSIALSISGLAISILLFSLSTLTAPNPLTFPWTTTGFLTLIAGAFTVSVYPCGLFSDTPGAGPLARSSILEEMNDAVIVVDQSHRLVDANDAAERTLGVTLARTAGRPLQEVLGWDPATAVTSPATVQTPNGQRRFDATQSSLTNTSGDPIGTAYVLQDVTDAQTRKQRLEVLNRVLRHNLRNDLDAIRAFAEALSDDTVDDPAFVAERIQRTSRDLVDLGTTVERAERILTGDTLHHQEVAVPALITDVADDVRDRTDCHIEYDSPTESERGPHLTTDRDVLRIILHELIENAVEHTDSDTPTVTITTTQTTHGVRVSVRDYGPGIPERERAVVQDGEETPLEHGTGVGLWFVSWAVTRLGGDLSFRDVDPGSCVQVTLPDHHPPAP